MSHSIDIVNTGRAGLYRIFTQGEYDLDCPFPEPLPMMDLGTTTHALWSLFRDRSDYFQNFDNLELMGTDGDVAYPFHSFFFDGEHWMRTPSGAAGLDLEGILKVGGVGNSPEAKYGIGVHFLLDTLPSPGSFRWIFFVGSFVNHFGVRVLSNATIEYVRKSGETTVCSVPGELDPDSWHSVYVVHDQTGIHPSGFFIDGLFLSSDGALSVNGGDPSAGDSTPFCLGRGMTSESVDVLPTWDSNSSHVKFNFTTDFLTAYSDATYSHGSCGCTGVLAEGGKYYWELVFSEGTYLWFGVAESGSDFTLSPALIGWVVACHNGRRWDHQTGGGTNWKAAIPLGSVIGMAYDGSARTLSIYVDGVSYGTLPYVIPGPVVPVIGSDSSSRVTLRPSAGAWSYSPPSAEYSGLPSGTAIVQGDDAPLFRGRMRLWRVLKGYPSDDEIEAFADVEVVPKIEARTLAGELYSLDKAVYKWYEDRGYIGIKTPNLPAGFYHLRARYRGKTTVLRRVNIRPFSSLVRNSSFSDDFTSVSKTINNWDVCHKAWGGANGGCSAHLVKIDPVEGVARMRCYGDLYVGPDAYGVDRLGNPTGRKTRVGSCLVSKHYYMPGEFNFRVRFPIETGVCAAIWGFHYEEAYPGDNLWQECLHDNLRRSGNEEDGHWIVRNHEIDIETPTALKNDLDHEIATFANGRFNSWRGELRNWDVAEDDPDYWSEYTDIWLPWPGGPINDGEIHDLQIKWVTDPEEIQFHSDGVLVATITENVPKIPMKWWIGVWFPSASTKWAGKEANWDKQDFVLHGFGYVPIEVPDSSVLLAPESYPAVGIRPLTLRHFEGW